MTDIITLQKVDADTTNINCATNMNEATMFHL